MCGHGKTEEIREAVAYELSHDPQVDAEGITAKNINGEVALNGMAPSYPQYLRQRPLRGVWLA